MREGAAVPRFMRVETAADALDLARRAGTPEDSDWRGWGALLAPLDDATTALSAALAAEHSCRVWSGEQGTLLAGALPSLRWIGLALAGSHHPPAAAVGAQLRTWTDAVSGIPAPLFVRGRTLDWSHPVVMGIVNVTPDSFSDGGRFASLDAAVDHGLQLVDEGASILDVGGESTRPRGTTYGAGAQPVDDQTEIERVVPVIRQLRRRTDAMLSVDTRKSMVAEAALEAGADIVNDVSGLLHDARLADVVRRHGAGLVLMHTPRDIEELAHEAPSEDIVADVLTGLGAALSRARGVPRSRVMLDPGLGFGKTAAHNLFLLRHAEVISSLGLPVVLGASRKAFLARAVAEDGPLPPPTERLGASVAAAVLGFLSGAHIIRAHDVRETVQALRVVSASRR